MGFCNRCGREVDPSEGVAGNDPVCSSCGASESLNEAWFDNIDNTLGDGVSPSERTQGRPFGHLPLALAALGVLYLLKAGLAAFRWRGWDGQTALIAVYCVVALVCFVIARRAVTDSLVRLKWPLLSLCVTVAVWQAIVVIYGGYLTQRFTILDVVTGSLAVLALEFWASISRGRVER